MGDVADYWNEHREYKRAKSLGMNAPQYAKFKRDLAVEEKAQRLKAHNLKCTIQCECGKWFENDRAHIGHKQKTGKKGHAVVATKSAGEPPQIEINRQTSGGGDE